MATMRPALFLDRDGVLNLDRGYVSRVEDFVWMDGAMDCIKTFKERNWYVFVVTNQSAIAFGKYTIDDMQTVHDHMIQDLANHGTTLDAIYYSPWHPDGSDPQYRKPSRERKPGPGMLLKAMADFPVNRAASFMIGDKKTDVEAAHAAGIGGFLFTGGNLAEFAEWALASFEDGAR